MFRRPWAAALLVAALLVITYPVACTTPPLTLEQRAEHQAALDDASEWRSLAEQAEQHLADAEVRIRDTLARAEELEARLSNLEASPDSAEPGELSGLVAELESVSAELEQSRDARAQAKAAREIALESESAALDRVADVEERAVRENGGALMDLIGEFFPPAKGASDLWLLLAALFFERPRDRVADAAKHTATALGSALKLEGAESLAEVREALRQIGASVGLKHTTDDPKQLVANAAKLAAKDRKLDLQGAQFELTTSYIEKARDMGGDPATAVIIELDSRAERAARASNPPNDPAT